MLSYEVVKMTARFARASITSQPVDKMHEGSANSHKYIFRYSSTSYFRNDFFYKVPKGKAKRKVELKSINLDPQNSDKKLRTGLWFIFVF